MVIVIKTAGTYAVEPGATYIIDPTMAGEVKFVADAADPAPVDFEIALNHSPTHTDDVKIKIYSDGDLSPKVTVADGYTGLMTEFDFKAAADTEFTFGDGVTIEKFEVSEDGQDIVTVGPFDRDALLKLGKLELDGNGPHDDPLPNDILTFDTSWMTADEVVLLETALAANGFAQASDGTWHAVDADGDGKLDEDRHVDLKLDLDGDGYEDFELKLHHWESISTKAVGGPAGDYTPTTTEDMLTLWEFEEDGSATALDTAPKGGLENGTLMGNAYMIAEGKLVLDGNGDYAVAGPDPDWQLDEGRIELVFNQTAHVGTSDDTLLSRDSTNYDDGGHLNITVTQHGAVKVRHQDDSNSYYYQTPNGFFAPGDDVRVTYAWDSDGEEGFFKVENLTSGTTYEQEIHQPLTLDNGATSEPFTVGAGQTVSSDNTANNLNEFFQGEISYVAIFDAATPSAGPDYIVEGTAGADLIDVAYTGDPEGDMIDAMDNETGTDADLVDAGAGDDTILAGADDDTVYAGAGDDSVEGGAGDDVIYGDSSLGAAAATGVVRESFNWSLAPDPNGALPIDNADPITGFTQNTGNVDVTFSVTAPNATVLNQYETTEQNVAGIDSGTETVDSDSSFYSETGGQGNSEAYALDFSSPVENVSFRINDVDGDGVVKVQAFDASGAPIEVALTLGSNLTGLDTDGVAGIDTADSNGGYLEDTAPQYSVLVQIPGPVSKITILHSQNGPANSGVNVTDVFFDAPVVVPDDGYDDTIKGGAGDDLVYGQTGDDSILGGDGNDTLYGDDPVGGAPGPVGPNLIVNGSFEDTTGLMVRGYGFAGNGAIPGWTDANGAEIDIHNDNRGGVLPTDGTNWLDLEATPGHNRVGQIVAGVADGETYVLTFDAGDKSDEPQSGNGENLVKVYWGGELVATIDPPAGAMQSFELELVGGAGDGSNKLEFVGTGDLDNFGASIDSVEMYLLSGDGQTGPAGNDTILGGDGSDLIDGQGGDDVLTGGAGDTIIGGEGSDTITLDPTEEDAGGSTASGITVDGSTEGADQDVLDLTGYESFRYLVETPDADGDSTSGTVEVKNTDGDWITVTFAEIETLLLPPAEPDPDGIVDGEEFGEVMELGYDDANAPTNQGGDLITNDGDVIEGNGGDDTIDGGTGDDVIEGNTGADSILGGEGDDLLQGGEGDDTIFGEEGNDTLDGGAGDDLLVTGNFNATFPVGGDTTLNANLADGGEGNDTILASVGADTLLGGAGDDSINGDDTIEGGDGADSVTGANGDDYIVAGAGDTVDGAANSDTIVVDPTLLDGAGDNVAPIVVHGGTSGLDDDGILADDDLDTLDLTQFVSYRNLVETTDADGDSTSGSVEVKNADGAWVPVTFTEIETLLLPPKEPDGVVDGEEFGETMNPGYDDANLPTDGGGDQIDGTDGLDDSIRGNGGDDLTMPVPGTTPSTAAPTTIP